MDAKKILRDSHLSHVRGARFISDFALVERDIDKYYITASSLDDGACRKSLLRRELYKLSRKYDNNWIRD